MLIVVKKSVCGNACDDDGNPAAIQRLLEEDDEEKSVRDEGKSPFLFHGWHRLSTTSPHHLLQAVSSCEAAASVLGIG